MTDDALFAGIDDEDMSEATRAAIRRNFERMSSTSLLSAANMMLDSDVILVAQGADGTEEHVRASSSVLQRTSTAFSGIFQETDGRTIKLWRPGPEPRQLQPIAAARFVLSVVHAFVAAQQASAAPEGLSMPTTATPPLDVLLAVCQIADCWDLCDAVLPAAARCLAIAAEEAAWDVANLGTLASDLVRIVRLIPAETDGHVLPKAWFELREAAEEALACHIPLRWLPSVIKSFDLEGAARVINRIGGTIVMLSKTLRGATALEPPWYGVEPASEGGMVTTDNVRCTAGRSIIRKGGEMHASLRSQFRLEISALESGKLKHYESLLESLAPSSLSMRSFLETRSEEARAKQLSVHIRNTGHGTALLSDETTLLIIPDGVSKMEAGVTQSSTRIEREFFNEEMIPSGQSIGYADLGSVKRLSGIRVEAKLVISELQNQYEVLSRWQALNRRPVSTGSSRIVSVLQRLQLDSGCFTTSVHLRLGTGQHKYDHQSHTVGALLLPKMVPTSLADSESPAARLCKSMKEYMMLRLERVNGPVNRATSLLDKATMLEMLSRETEPFETVHGLQEEKALLRIAVDWSSMPWREPADIKDVLGKIFWAGVPTRTLMHLDQGSGWDTTKRAHTHTLRDRLLKLVEWNHPLAGSLLQYKGFDHGEYGMQFVEEFIVAALDHQRKREHIASMKDEDARSSSALLRACFKDSAPEYPDGQTLHDIMLEQTHDTRLKETQREAEAQTKDQQLKDLEAENKELKAEIERLKQADSSEPADEPMCVEALKVDEVVAKEHEHNVADDEERAAKRAKTA